MKKNYLLSTYNRNILSIAGTHFTSYSPCSFGFTYAFSCPILYRNFSSSSFLFSSYTDSNQLVKDSSRDKNSLEYIKSIPIWRKGKFNAMYFDIKEFNQKNLIEKFVEKLNLNTTYSILIKFGFAENQLFYMDKTGQIGIVIEDKHDLAKYKQIYNSTLDKLYDIIKEYNIEYEVNGIQIMFVTLKDKPELKLIKGLSAFKYDRKLVDSNIKNINSDFSSKFIPLTLNESYYGKPLIGDKLDIFIKQVNNQRSIYGKPLFNLEDGVSIYLNNNYVIISKLINENTIEREIFDFLLGTLVKKVIDYIDKDGTGFIRNIDKINLRIEGDKVSYLESIKKLDYIKPKKKISKGGTNNNIGTFDIETFVDDDGKSKIYALGFVTIGNNPNLYHINDYSNSSSLVLACLNDMLKTKYNNFTFYTHNFGKFDVVFLLKIIDEAFSTDNRYEFDCICRDQKILRLTITTKINKTKIKISIIDSINLLSGSLANLAKDFGSEVTKGDFPHEFVNRNTLKYIGETPDKNYFKNLDNKTYLELYKDNWNLMKESLTYLKRDLSAHLFVMSQFNSYIFINYFLQMTDALTISRLSLDIYLNKYLNDNKIPLIKKYDMYSFIKKGYYGGITEVYKAYGENLYYYDVNSLYPYVSKNPMPGIDCIYKEDLSGKGLDLTELFGFFYCEVITSNGYLGLLPIHTEEGDMINPNGKYSGVWSSEELKFAVENGYQVKVIKGYNFSKTYNLFDNFVNDLYLKKCYPESPTEKSVSKSLLNNNTGRWGMSIDKPITELVNVDELDYILSTRIVNNNQNIGENLFLVTYMPRPSKKVCIEHGYNYDEIIKKDFRSDIENNNNFSDVSIPISAMITAYGRIYMNSIKLDILNKGGNIYYMDTDSIVCDIELSKEKVGIELGKFKLEHFIEKAYFISNKTYCLLLKNGSYIIKSKGVLSSSLTPKDFEDMYYNKMKIKGLKGDTKINYKEGYVNINTKEAILNHDAYIKRTKIYNEKGLWIDTKPLVINK